MRMRYYAIVALMAATFALALRYSVVEAYRIPSPTMKPSLEPGDTVFVYKYPFGFRLPFTQIRLTSGRAPRFGEVLVFQSPEIAGQEFIRRVVGLPGDRVAIVDGGVVLNGNALGENSKTGFLCGMETAEKSSYPICWDPPVMEDVPELIVPEGYAFLISDLRSSPKKGGSLDSWSLVKFSDVIGKAAWVWLSIRPQIAAKDKSSGFFSWFSWISRIRFERSLTRVK